MTRTVLYPGSFDPLTNGHLDIIERAARLFDTVVIAIGAHHGKTPMLTLEMRVKVATQVAKAAARRSRSRVEVTTFNGLVVEAARASGAIALVRGIRDSSDFDYEMRMSNMNGAMAGEVETVFLAASPATAFISSTLIRQIAGMGGDIADFVPRESARAIAAALRRR